MPSLKSQGGRVLEWLFIILGLLVWLVFRGRRARRLEEQDQGGFSQFRSESVGQYRTGNWNSGTSDPQGNARLKNSSPTRWVAAGESVSVGSFTLDRGMFYLGGLLPGESIGSCGNCVIDPKVKVASSGDDREGQTMPYWPSYQSISPVARRTYLSWLSGDRSDPLIGIGYVFLYFYGIERRMFLDRTREEAPLLIAEVGRLLDIYGHNGSFRGYASKFLDAAGLINGAEFIKPRLGPDLRSGYEIPIPVRVYLGRKLAAKETFDAYDALLWVLSLPDSYLRTPATRCFEELVELWRIRFRSRYPNGLKVNVPKTRLKLEYRAASGGFNCSIDMTDAVGPLPDIAAISAPLDGLRDMLNACTEELAPYSRLLGRNPDAKGKFEAICLLPQDLIDSPAVGGGLLLAAIERFFGDRRVVGIPVSRLAHTLSLDVGTTGKISTGHCNQIATFLERFDIAIEPDRRYGSRNLQADGQAVLFKAPGGAKIDSEAPAFLAARARVDIAILAAASDGKIDVAEFDAVKAEIRAMDGLGSSERARLIVYANTMIRDTPSQQAILNKIKKLAHSEKEGIIRSATAAILADGHVAPDEVKFLERLYRALSRPVEGVYATLHRGSVVVDEPVAIMPEMRTTGIPVPPQPASSLASPVVKVEIDPARLERIRSETSAVSELLAGIFVEEPPEAIAPPSEIPVPASTVTYFAGLDPLHAALLELLVDSAILPRDEFENAAKNLRLLPDGAIERINDWGFDRFEEPIIDDEADVSIPEHIRSELKQEIAAQ